MQTGKQWVQPVKEINEILDLTGLSETTLPLIYHLPRPPLPYEFIRKAKIRSDMKMPV